MKRTTKKMSGTALELFLRRFYLGYRGIDDALARQLSRDTAKAFASARVKRVALQTWRAARSERAGRERDEGAARVVPSSDDAMTTSGTTAAHANRQAPSSEKSDTPLSAEAPAAVESKPAPLDKLPLASAKEAPFDPYAIGLVPTYQREGAEGLAAKLAEVTALDDLRKMARLQQVALPAELRAPDADIEAVRAAIVAAVARRIANRRAAAG